MTISVPDVELSHETALINGINLHYVQAGEGPLVVLLHGFPEFWYSWRHQFPALAQAGYTVVAVDMRGYNTSDSPEGVKSYGLDTLAQDISSLIEHLGEKEAHVVGHDWGGAVAWHVGMRHPDQVRSLTILNSPHPRVLQKALGTLRQALKSWYMMALQVPWLPELLIGGNYEGLIRGIYNRDFVNKDAISDAEIELYAEALGSRTKIKGPIQYYRAALRHPPKGRGSAIEAPTLLLWGRYDRYLGEELATASSRDVPNLQVEMLEASHWVQVDAADLVNEKLITFFGEH